MQHSPCYATGIRYHIKSSRSVPIEWLSTNNEDRRAQLVQRARHIQEMIDQSNKEVVAAEQSKKGLVGADQSNEEDAAPDQSNKGMAPADESNKDVMAFDQSDKEELGVAAAEQQQPDDVGAVAHVQAAVAAADATPAVSQPAWVVLKPTLLEGHAVQHQSTAPNGAISQPPSGEFDYGQPAAVDQQSGVFDFPDGEVDRQEGVQGVMGGNQEGRFQQLASEMSPGLDASETELLQSAAKRLDDDVSIHTVLNAAANEAATVVDAGGQQQISKDDDVSDKQRALPQLPADSAQADAVKAAQGYEAAAWQGVSEGVQGDSVDTSVQGDANDGSSSFEVPIIREAQPIKNKVSTDQSGSKPVKQVVVNRVEPNDSESNAAPNSDGILRGNRFFRQFAADVSADVEGDVADLLQAAAKRLDEAVATAFDLPDNLPQGFTSPLIVKPPGFKSDRSSKSYRSWLDGEDLRG